MSEAAPQAAEGMSAEDAKLLGVLQMLWEDVYSVGYDQEHGWWASRDGVIGRILTAGSAEELGRALAEDRGGRAVNSGFSYVRGNTGHSATPLAGSYVTEKTGEPATLVRYSDYPVIAACRVCHGRIRLGQLTQADWQHAPLHAAAAGGDAA